MRTHEEKEKIGRLMIEIINYEPVDKNKVIGYADVNITFKNPVTLTFRRISHLSNNGKKWINLPCFSKPNTNGGLEFHRYMEITDQSRNVKLMEMLSEEIKKYMELNRIEESREDKLSKPVFFNYNETLPF